MAPPHISCRAGSARECRPKSPLLSPPPGSLSSPRDRSVSAGASPVAQFVGRHEGVVRGNDVRFPKPAGEPASLAHRELLQGKKLCHLALFPVCQVAHARILRGWDTK